MLKAVYFESNCLCWRVLESGGDNHVVPTLCTTLTVVTPRQSSVYASPRLSHDFPVCISLSLSLSHLRLETHSVVFGENTNSPYPSPLTHPLPNTPSRADKLKECGPILSKLKVRNLLMQFLQPPLESRVSVRLSE